MSLCSKHRLRYPSIIYGRKMPFTKQYGPLSQESTPCRECRVAGNNKFTFRNSPHISKSITEVTAFHIRQGQQRLDSKKHTIGQPWPSNSKPAVIAV